MKPIDTIRVVIIEDNVDNLDLATTLLREDVGIQHLTTWASGRMFFKWLHESASTKLNPHQRSIDLILLDLQIPIENGYEVLKKIRTDPLLRDTRVIAVTANVMSADVTRAQAAGFHGFIGKPINVDRFPAQITRILAGESLWEPE